MQTELGACRSGRATTSGGLRRLLEIDPRLAEKSDVRRDVVCTLLACGGSGWAGATRDAVAWRKANRWKVRSADENTKGRRRMAQLLERDQLNILWDGRPGKRARWWEPEHQQLAARGYGNLASRCRKMTSHVHHNDMYARNSRIQNIVAILRAKAKLSILSIHRSTISHPCISWHLGIGKWVGRLLLGGLDSSLGDLALLVRLLDALNPRRS